MSLLISKREINKLSEDDIAAQIRMLQEALEKKQAKSYEKEVKKMKDEVRPHLT